MNWVYAERLQMFAVGNLITVTARHTVQSNTANHGATVTFVALFVMKSTIYKGSKVLVNPLLSNSFMLSNEGIYFPSLLSARQNIKWVFQIIALVDSTTFSDTIFLYMGVAEGLLRPYRWILLGAKIITRRAYESLCECVSFGILILFFAPILVLVYRISKTEFTPHKHLLC